MGVLYITSNHPLAGKTALATALALRLSGAGEGVRYFKPFSPTPQGDADVEFIRRSVLAGGDEMHSAPLAMPEGLEGGQLIPEEMGWEVRSSLKGLAAGQGTVLVEGPSLVNTDGIASPISSELAALLDARVVLIVRYGLELNVDRLLEACEPFGQRLLGVLINCVTRYKERHVRLELAPAIESSGVKFLGDIPEDRLLSSVTVGQIAQHLDAQWVIGEDGAQELVENVLIGGNIMDPGTTYFGRKEGTAVIVRGDRPDIQLAALSVPTTCLVLTGGHEPIQYVYHQAEQQGVPLLVVQTDTISTADALDSVPERAVFHHLRKLKRFQELTQACVDVAAIEAGL